MTVATVEQIHKPIQTSTNREEVNSLRRAIELKKSGDTAGARKLLVTICRQNTASETGWFLLASVARNPQERLACLKQVLRINPAHQAARDWQQRLQPEEATAAEEKPVVAAAVAEPVAVAAPEVEPAPALVESAPATSSFPPLFAMGPVEDSAVEVRVDEPETMPAAGAVEAPTVESDPGVGPASVPADLRFADPTMESMASLPAPTVPEPIQPGLDEEMTLSTLPALEAMTPATAPEALTPLASEVLAVPEFLATPPPPLALEMGEAVEAPEPTAAPEAMEVHRFENVSPRRVMTLPPPPVALLAAPEMVVEMRYVEIAAPPPVVASAETAAADSLTFENPAMEAMASLPSSTVPGPVKPGLAEETAYAVPPVVRTVEPSLEMGAQVVPPAERAAVVEPAARSYASVNPSKLTTLPPPQVSRLGSPAMEMEGRYAEVPEPKAAASEAVVETPVAPAVIAPTTLVPTSGVAYAAEPVATEAPAQSAKAEIEPDVLCPLCEAPMHNAERCGVCKSSIWPEKPMDYVLNRNADVELLHALVERLRVEPCTVWGELRLALANANLHRFHYARQHLERAAMLDLKASTYALDRMAAFLRRPVVMVVDDSATIRDVLVRLLGNDGFLPVPVGNSWEVMPAVKAQKPSVVLLDVTMPMMDGYDVCRLIRGDRETRSIPVVMVSGNGDLIDKVVGKLAGASDYLHKPFKPEQLLNVVRGHVFKKR